jgi:hypothetical protein
MQNSSKNKQYKTLISVIANGSEAKAKEMLKRETGQSVYDTKELEYKISEMYANSKDKIEIEKKLYSIHPHKDFISKYYKLENPPIEKELIVKTEDVDFSNCNGSVCQSCSSASGEDTKINKSKSLKIDNSIVVLGLVTIVSVLSLVSLIIVYNKK